MFHLKSTVMIRIITLVILFFVSQFIQGQSEDTIKEKVQTNITVMVPNLSSSDGEVIVALYNSSESFLTREPLAIKKSTIVDGKVLVVFENIVAGTYAIACLHDKNANERMDFDASGMPLEGYGSSNNSMQMGPPNFEDAKFTVENKSLDLTIRF